MSSNFAARQMVVSLARRLAQCTKVQVGINSPLAEAAALLARRIGNGKLTVYLTGMASTFYQPDSVSLFRSQWELIERGYGYPVEVLLDRLCGPEGVDDEPLHPLQIDGHGSVNLGQIRLAGEVVVVGPGTAGLDLLPYLQHGVPTLYTTRHSRRVLVERVSEPTAWARGGGSRRILITNLCIFEIGGGRPAELVSLHQGVSIADVLELTEFEFEFERSPAVTRVPSEDELCLLEAVDPLSIHEIEFLPSGRRLDLADQIWRAEVFKD